MSRFFSPLDLQNSILAILLNARRRKPKSGGATTAAIHELLNQEERSDIELVLFKMRERGFVEQGERSYMITSKGVLFVMDKGSSYLGSNVVSSFKKQLRSILQTLNQFGQDGKPNSVSGREIIDRHGMSVIEEIEFSLWFSRERGFMELGDGGFLITDQGRDYLQNDRSL